MSLIELSDIGKSYHGQTALKGVTFTVEAGEFLAIVGPSGSGKTTLLNMIGAIDKPTTGRIAVDGLDLTMASDDALAMHRRQKIGFVFQSFFLSPQRTALENVLLPLHFGEHKAASLKDKAMAALQQVGLAALADRPAANLSGGQRQHVAMARALVTQPAILLADEPIGNLDAQTGQEVLELLSAYHRERKATVIVVTHEKLLLEAATRSLEIREGTLV